MTDLRQRAERMSDTPKRIQRKRTKGWKMPPNTVYVGRPSKYGNPFTVEEWGREIAINNYRVMLEENILAQRDVKVHLGGKNLACWCPLDQPCHADVLLEIANGK